MSSKNLFDDMARMAGGALGALGGMKDEIERMVQQATHRMLDKADLVTREEFEIVRDMAVTAREENAALAVRLEALEKKPARKPAAKKTATEKTAAKSTPKSAPSVEKPTDTP